MGDIDTKHHNTACCDTMEVLGYAQRSEQQGAVAAATNKNGMDAQGVHAASAAAPPGSHKHLRMHIL